ncbi:hypothetical protein BofuT4_P010130.1 [Botrytis cinerea T4]|nr:hypothetical protein BofuT4_P010130.1 [Botrytis cinerea T4]
MLSNIHEDYTDIVVAALMLLVICHEKPTIRESAEAVAARMDSKSSFNINNRFSDSEELLDILGSLVTHNTDYSRPQLHDPYFVSPGRMKSVQLSHSSVCEYLTSTYLNVTYMNGFDELSLHLFALECCLNYIDWPAGREDLVQYLGSSEWRETWLRTENDRDYLAPDIQNAEWKNGNDLGTTIYYASLLKLTHVERFLADEYNTTVDGPLQLGECPPLSVAIHFENASHVQHFIRMRERGYTEYESCQIALELAIEKSGSFLLMVLIEIIRFVGESVSMEKSIILDVLPLITNKCDSMLIDDVCFLWKPLSYALLHPDQENSAFVVRSKLKIHSEWPMILQRRPCGIEEILFAVAISMDSIESFQLFLDYLQGFEGHNEYHLLPILAAFAQCDKEAKLLFLIERAGTLGLTETSMFQDIMWEVLERRAEVVLKLLLGPGMHPDLPYCDLWYCITGSTKSPLQQAVYKRWRAVIPLLLKRGTNVNYLDVSDISITPFTCFGPLGILRRGIKDPDIPPGSDDDSSGNDRLIEELLVSEGATIYEYEQNVSSDGSTDGRVSEGFEIEFDEELTDFAKIMVDNECEDLRDG